MNSLKTDTESPKSYIVSSIYHISFSKPYIDFSKCYTDFPMFYTGSIMSCIEILMPYAGNPVNDAEKFAAVKKIRKYFVGYS